MSPRLTHHPRAAGEGKAESEPPRAGSRMRPGSILSWFPWQRVQPQTGHGAGEAGARRGLKRTPHTAKHGVELKNPTTLPLKAQSGCEGRLRLQPSATPPVQTHSGVWGGAPHPITPQHRSQSACFRCISLPQPGWEVHSPAPAFLSRSKQPQDPKAYVLQPQKQEKGTRGSCEQG